MVESNYREYAKKDKEFLVKDIEALRLNIGASIHEFSKEMDVSMDTYFSWKYGRSFPNPKSIEKIVAFMESEKPEKLREEIRQRKEEIRQRRLGRKSTREWTKEDLERAQKFLNEIAEFRKDYELNEAQLLAILKITQNTWEKWTEGMSLPSVGKMFDLRDRMRTHRKENPIK